MKTAFPTFQTAIVMQKWGNRNPAMYANGRHMGIDLGNLPVGTPIFAACDGVVDTVNLEGAHGYGRHVIMQHDGFKTLYAHLHRVMVTQGQTVAAGTAIGEMGGDPHDNDPIDGASTGTHLHFEVILPYAPKIDSIKTFAGWTVDPFAYLLNRFTPAPIYRGKVIEKTGVRVRPEPNNQIASRYIGSLSLNDEFDVAEVNLIDAKGFIWCRVRSLRMEYVCVAYQAKEYVKLGSAPDVVVSYEPVDSDQSSVNSGQVDEKAVRLDEVNRLIQYLDQRKKDLTPSPSPVGEGKSEGSAFE